MAINRDCSSVSRWRRTSGVFPCRTVFRFFAGDVGDFEERDASMSVQLQLQVEWFQNCLNAVFVRDGSTKLSGPRGFFDVAVLEQFLSRFAHVARGDGFVVFGLAGKRGVFRGEGVQSGCGAGFGKQLRLLAGGARVVGRLVFPW